MTYQDKKLNLLTEIAKLPPQELAKVMVMAERLRVRALAKTNATKKYDLKKTKVDQNMASHYGIQIGTPLNPKR